MRSRIASASVGSSRYSYHLERGNWEQMMVEATSYRSSRICRRMSFTCWVMDWRPKSSRIMSCAFFRRLSHLMSVPSVFQPRQVFFIGSTISFRAFTILHLQPQQVFFIGSTIYFRAFTILHLFHAKPSPAPPQCLRPAAALGLAWEERGRRPAEA